MDLYLQFYNSVPYTYNTGKPTSYLENGFSYIWEVEPQWIDFDKPLTIGDEIRKASKVYISLWNWFEFKRAFTWAKKYFPSTKFVFGGPLIRFFSREVHFKDIAAWPLNVEIHEGLAEELIGKKPDKTSWKLVPPKDSQHPFYSYHIQDGCYWNKCTFCHYTEGTFRGDFKLEPLHDAPAGTVWLECPSLPPKYLYYLPYLDFTNKDYQMFVRAEKPIERVLKQIASKISDTSKIMFRIGIEFPSERKLSKMNKGITFEEMLTTLNTIHELGFRQMLLYICKWRDLLPSDLDEAKKFLDSLHDTKDARTFHALSRLVVFGIDDSTTWHHQFFKKYWHFYALEPEYEKLDNEWISLVRNRPGFVHNPYFEWSMSLPTDEEINGRSAN